ncbi:MAG: putative ABC transporter permease [Ruminococcus flavefaciens]|nr:putative ABC transporter permease [Ruminococcus flavefaciens]
MKRILKIFILFLLGGVSYLLVEMAYRGHTHWTMLLVGGICFVLIGVQNEIYTWEMPLVLQCVMGSVIVTTVEFVSGCVINLLLGWGVWDYSDLPCNLLGQICLLFSVFWVFLSIPAIILDDYLRYWLFGGEKPHYILFGGKKL